MFTPIRRFFFKTKNLGTCELIHEVGKVSTARWIVPDHIQKPSYYDTKNKPSRTYGTIEIKNEEQIARMRESCKLAANILDKCKGIVNVGVTVC